MWVEKVLPEFLYKLVPCFYIGLGIYTWVKLDTVFSILASTMLVSAGIVVVFMRETARYQKRAYQTLREKLENYGPQK